jgi:hypothetical protein
MALTKGWGFIYLTLPPVFTDFHELMVRHFPPRKEGQLWSCLVQRKFPGLGLDLRNTNRNGV